MMTHLCQNSEISNAPLQLTKSQTLFGFHRFSLKALFLLQELWIWEATLHLLVMFAECVLVF